MNSLQGRANGGPRKIGDIELNLTNVIIGLNILIYALTKGIFGIGGSTQRLNKLMKVNRAIAYGQSYRLITSCFCHGSPYHLAINSYSLYNMGPQAERLLGKGRYLFLYLFSGISANYITYLINASPYALGSSGCVFGLIGAFGMHFYRNKKILGNSANASLDSIKRTVMINLFYGASQPGIDNGAHVAGMLMGALGSYLIGPRLIWIPQEFGRSRVGDKPIVPYRKMIRTFSEFLAFYLPKPQTKSSSKFDDEMMDWV